MAIFDVRQKTKTCWIFLSLFSLAACATQRISVYDVGRRESARLRDSHERWLAERPRKFDMMSVPASALSKEARDAGFREATVDSRLVLLSTAESEGLLFGTPSETEVDGLKSLGFTVERTGEMDIFRFRVTPTKEPNPGLSDIRS